MHCRTKKFLQSVRLFLGDFISRPSNWTPLAGICEETHIDYGIKKKMPTVEDQWQFDSFLFDAY